MIFNLAAEKEDLELIAKQVNTRVWSALKNKSIFITGGTGFIGCWLLETLIYANNTLQLNSQITVLSRNPDAFRQKAPHLATANNITLIKGNMTSLQHIEGQFDIVLHVATDVVNPHQDSKIVFDDIKHGTEEILALTKRCGATHFLLTSSGAIYGRQPPELMYIDELFTGSPDLVNAKSAYGLGKRYSEWLVNLHGADNKINTQIARCFAFTGPYMVLDAQFAIGNFIGDCIENRNIIIGGDGTPYRSYLYAADLIVWLLTILIEGDGAPYNVGSDRAVQISELAHLARDILKTDNQIIIKKSAATGQLPERYIPSVERAKKLGLSEYTSLETSIKKTAIWNQKLKELGS